MGGDKAPGVILDGVFEFLSENNGASVVLVGRKAELEALLERHPSNFQNSKNQSRLSLVDAPDVITMGDSPVKSIREKPQSSIVRMMEMLKQAEVDAVMSAGNTGAMVACATLKLRTLKNIDRPAIATVIPTPYGRNILLDVGAVPDCKLKNYFQFAVMGFLVAKLILGKEKPKIGLLNVGEEDSKGHDEIKAVYNVLKNTNLPFHGNVEGRDIFKDTVDVIVTDGFVGNIVLKASESLASGIFSVIKQELCGSIFDKLAALFLKNTFGRVKKQFDHEEYGGALLLGVNGIVVIAHGSSTSRSVKNALHLSVKMADQKINNKIMESMETYVQQ